MGITIDICILNAATALPGSRMTECGQDEMFLVNYLSNVLLSRLLIKKSVLELKDSVILSRLIFISSDSHQGATRIDYQEFGRYFEYGVSKGISNYSYFKLVLNTYATELSRRINDPSVRLSINIICPGPVHSNIVKEAPWLLRMILKGIFRIIFKSPSKSSPPCCIYGSFRRLQRLHQSSTFICSIQKKWIPRYMMCRKAPGSGTVR